MSSALRNAARDVVNRTVGGTIPVTVDGAELIKVLRNLQIAVQGEDVLCKGAWALGTACRTCARCIEDAPGYIMTLESDLASVKADRDSHLRSWQRALGDKLIPKQHLIDSLVLTTEHLRQNHDKWARETASSIERERVRRDARTLGLDPEDYL